MIKQKIVVFVAAIIFATVGFAAWRYYTSPEYSLMLMNKAVEQNDAVTFEKYVDLEGIIRRAGGQLSAELAGSLAQELGSLGKLNQEMVGSVMTAFSSAMLEGTIKHVRESIRSYIETGRATPIQSLPEGTLEMTQDMTIDTTPLVTLRGKMATIDLNLKVIGESVPVRLFMRDMGSYWQIAEIDEVAHTSKSILEAYYIGLSKRMEAERKANPDQIIAIPGLVDKDEQGELITPLTIVYVPAGKFKMGSPPAEKDRMENETLHLVTLSKGFWIGKYEVTKGQFAGFVKETGYVTTAEIEGSGYSYNGNEWGIKKGATWKDPGMAEQHLNEPVVLVSWEDAQAFCQWLSKVSGKSVTLPTEAQWEYACRAGSTTAYAFGDYAEDALFGRANVRDIEFANKIRSTPDHKWSDGYMFTAPVGIYEPNAWGLHDMHGNVWEWCSDVYGDYGSLSVADPSGPVRMENVSRVFRGGGWGTPSRFLRSAARVGNSANFRGAHLGFRVCIR